MRPRRGGNLAAPRKGCSPDLAHCLLGGSGQTQYVYNWTVDGPSAQYGPYTTNRSAVLLFKP
ncbi:MAG: hypothetical protein IT458_17780 [Planctomycetes bacterium]|nr:hypothetical protein [Planctomycetota bacterium]